MDKYVTGAMIRRLREDRKMTQEALAEKIHVSGKAVSKWETGQGFPDISLLEPLAKALGISVIELFSGECVRNENRAANMLKGKFYVCPVCGNVIRAAGEATVSCCGVTLPSLEAEEPDEAHTIQVETVEDEYYVSVTHPMTKEHSISFLAAVSDQGVQFVKLYPEGNAEARFKRSGVRLLLAYCSHHGLFQRKVYGRIMGEEV
ncbi:MAG: helix-turn-helix domain-containing protein [Lachnospiraceae bacterium]|nr:helix-turn-helix domain-containing protein [Lachnospiraceae bacterium]